MAYGAEYMINSCLAGKTHVWYVKLSLTSVLDIVHQLLEMKERSDDWPLRSVSNTSADGLSMQDRRSGTELNEIIVGFQEEEQSILEQLLGGTGNLQKVGIVGTPGLGKTSLEKKLHNHPAICNRFDKRSWCVVSQGYQRKDLLVDILKSLGKVVKPDIGEAKLALQMYQTLKYRRYIVTLDDIWNLNAWDDLCSCFPDEKNGSRILFTSRNKDAAPLGGIINSLPFLSNEQCWELIRNLVFRGETCPPMLEEIGKEISAKCKGLPLVATVIAGILSAVNKELKAWKNVMQDLELPDILDQNEQVLQTLEISYKHLLQHLKPCFLYFALFREEEKISVKKLKQFWVAEGFVEEDEEKKKGVESIAGEYLMELINKSLVMVVERGSDGKVKTCGMHDLLHSMCIRIAEEEKFLKRVDYSCSSLESLKFNRLLFLFSFTAYGSWPRSIFIHPRQSYSVCGSSFVDNTSLRVLDDQSYHMEVILKNVVRLRYLAVSDYQLNSIESFLKLEYLILRRSTVCISQIRKFRKLRFLKARKVVVDKDCEISQLPNNLEYLSDLEISDLKCIQLLKSTRYLRRLKFYMVDRILSIYNFSLDLDLSFLSHLESLSIHSDNDVSNRVVKRFGKGIKLPSSIKKLSIVEVGYLWTNMSMIGKLPNLEVLKLQKDACLGDTWNTSSDSEFRNLRFLKLKGRLHLRQWNISSSECFPCLQQIVLDGLHFLEKIPREIGEIETLQLFKLSECSMSVAWSAKEIEREQHAFGNENFRVITKNIY